jgi:hypothetical protein
MTSSRVTPSTGSAGSTASRMGRITGHRWRQFAAVPASRDNMGSRFPPLRRSLANVV